MLDARTGPEVARRVFGKELHRARRRHSVYVLNYLEDSPHLPAYRQTVTGVLRKKGYRGAMTSVDIDRHADLARSNFFDVGGRPYTINASLPAYIDGTPFSLSYPGIAGVTPGPLGDDVVKLQSGISGFVERTDQAFAEPAK